MLTKVKQSLAVLLILASSFSVAGLANAASGTNAGPKGIWIDHTGRGAIEIVDCNNKLCGRIVWLEEGQPREACGRAVIGDVKFVGDGKWDKGWIYDPELDAKFDVELTPLANGTLQVLGYAGLKALSETMVWKRAPVDIKTCSIGDTAVAK